MSLIRFFRLPPARQADLREWITRLGLNPEDVSDQIELSDLNGVDSVLFRVFLRDGEGHRYADPGGNDTASRLVSAPLADGPAWLQIGMIA